MAVVRPQACDQTGGIIEKLVLLLVAPLVLVILVLGWFYLMSRGRAETRLTLRGLGVTIQIAHSPHVDKETTNDQWY